MLVLQVWGPRFNLQYCKSLKTNSLLARKNPGQDRFIVEFFQTFKGELTLIILKLFHRIEREGILSIPFCEASITLILNWIKIQHQKKKKKIIDLFPCKQNSTIH
jgi:prolipoprotein diacylglyceryltransferase